MKTIIQILISVLVLTGCFNIGKALLYEYQFEDKVHEGLLFDPLMTDAQIVDLVLKAAAEHGVPIDASGITVHQVGPEVRVDMTYTDDIVIIPGVFTKSWTFSPSASTRILVGKRRQPS